MSSIVVPSCFTLNISAQRRHERERQTGAEALREYSWW